MARPRQFSDADILDTARVCFLEHGPSVSTTVIARVVGVSQAALFKRFGTKEDLMIAALAPPAVPDWVVLVMQGPSDAPIEDQLVELGLQMAAFFQRLIPHLAVLKASGSCLQRMLERFGDRPPPVAGHQAITAWLTQAQAQGRIAADVEAATVAFGFMGALHSRAFMRHIGPHFFPELDDTEAYVRGVVSTLWNGIAPEATP